MTEQLSSNSSRGCKLDEYVFDLFILFIGFSDHELLTAKFRLKLNKVEKNTRPFRYDINQIPYDYTVKVRNRFKGLDLIDRVPDELWRKVCYTVQETDRDHSHGKEMQKSKMAV